MYDDSQPSNHSTGVLTPDSAESRSGSAPRTSNRYSYITCSGCDASWTGVSAAHCSACHCTFSSAGLFDRHRSVAGGEHGSCLPPGRLVNANTGEPVMFFRDEMWRGPTMDEETKAKRFGGVR